MTELIRKLALYTSSAAILATINVKKQRFTFFHYFGILVNAWKI